MMQRILIAAIRSVLVAFAVIVVGFALIGLVTVLTFQKLSVPTRTVDKPVHALPPETSLAEHYLDVLKRHLTRSDYPMTTAEPLAPALRRFLENRGISLAQYQLGSQEDGTTWPESAETMIGMKRLDNLHYCIREALARKIPGDLIECGAWRGGATIFMPRL